MCKLLGQLWRGWSEMKNEIRDKLQAELSNSIERESQVAYLLVEVRKLIEQMPDEEGKKWATLKLYCDWALHAGIRRRADFPTIADEEFSREVKKEGDWDPERRLGKLLLMDTFRWQLVFFLEGMAVEHPFGIDSIAWSRFLHLYGQVVADCPHEWRASRAKRVRSIKLRPPELRFEGPILAELTLFWDFEFKDGRTATLSSKHLHW